jgi:glutathione S-transferase
MDTLYYYPGACSLSVHAVLEETGHAYEAKRIDIHGGENDTPEYRKLHPRGLVPVLATAEGLLTEAPAILLYLAERHPEAGLLPPERTIERTRCHEWLLLGATHPHPAFARVMRPERLSDSPDAVEPVRERGRRDFHDALRELDERLAGRAWALGERYSVADPYLMIFYLWGRFIGLPVGELRAYSTHFERVTARPAVQRAIAAEELPLVRAA